MSRLNINRRNRKSKIGIVLYNHIINNKREYFIISILFFIGLIVGVFFINNTSNVKLEEINSYLNDMIKNIKSYENIDFVSLFKESVTSNLITILILWIGAPTIIGIIVVYGSIIFKGFNIGYTISSIISCFGIGKGILISFSIMVLHNIVSIPAIFGASLSGVKLYQYIIKNRDRNNIKIEIIRHTLFCVFMLILMILSSVIEVYISTNIFINLLKKINF